MPVADRVNEWIEIDEIAYRDRDAAHELPGYSYKGGKTRCKLSWSALKVLVTLFPGRLEIGPALEEWAWEEYESRVQPATEAHDWAMDPGNECTHGFYEKLKECGLA